jgi:VWFA-related protein
MRPKRCLALALAGLIGAAPSPAQTDKPAAGTKLPPPVFGSGLAVVSVPVFVTGKDGKAVAGLTAEDFEVQDEGKPVKVVGFHEIDATKPVPPGQTFRGASASRRQFMLLFDLSFTSSRGLVRSREAAKEFVRNKLGPADLAAVATFSVNTGMRLVIGFTPDRRQLESAVDGLGLLDVNRKADPLALVYAHNEGALGLSDKKAMREELLQEELRTQQVQMRSHESGDYRRKVTMLTKGMTQLAEVLDAVQGRKQIIYLSAGFDQSTLLGEQGSDAAASSEAVVEGRLWEVNSDSRFGDAGIRGELDQMLRALSGADVVVHTVDVTGLATRADASQATGDDQQLGSGRESLSQIAGGTGGRFYRDTNDLSVVLGEILDATQHYYVLAFEPQVTKGVGKLHKLKVRVRGKDRDVSARNSYVEVNPAAVKSALSTSLQSGEAIVKGLTGGEIRVTAIAVPYRSADGNVSVPVAVEIDGPSLLARGGKSGGNLVLQIYGYALDAEGRVEDFVALAPTLDLAKVGAKLKESGLQLHTAFTLPAGSHSLRFLVRDGERNRRGLESIDVVIPGFEAGTLLVAPPLFMDDPTHWLVLQSPSRGTAKLDLPFRVETDAFAPRGKPHLANGRTDKVCVLTYDGGTKSEASAQYAISASLMSGDGTPVRLGKMALAKAVAETDGYRRFVLNVTPTDVPPGDYRFKVKVKDPVSGNTVESSGAISVE